MPEANIGSENNRGASGVEMLTLVLTTVNLILIALLAYCNAQEQRTLEAYKAESAKSLEAYKEDLSSADLSYTFSNGTLKLTNKGKREAQNVELYLASEVPFTYQFVRLGIIPFDPSMDEDLSPGRILIFKISKFPPSQLLVLNLFTKASTPRWIASSEIVVRIVCSNCSGLATEH